MIIISVRQHVSTDIYIYNLSISCVDMNIKEVSWPHNIP